MTDPQTSQALDPELISLLRCPLTHSPLRQDGEFLVAEVGGLRYPIRDGIPVMLIEEAKLPPPFRTIEEFKAHFRDAIAP
jgi:hypothetical protein